MKLTSLSKSVRTIGLMAAVLSVLVGTTIQQTVQAQNKVPTDSETSCFGGNGYPPPNELEGIKFTPEQDAAYQRFREAVDAKNGAIYKNAPLGPEPLTGLSFGDEKAPVSPEMQAEIIAAFDVITLDEIPDRDQAKAFKETYGKYADLEIGERSTEPTPEQDAEMNNNIRNLEPQTLSILTPEQQKVFQANLVMKRAYEACNPIRRSA
jgi:hypothetical protein